MANKNVKVVVTGAGGHIGYALLYRIASGQMFGPNVSIELCLLELEKSVPILSGLQMELEDCAFPLLINVICTSDLKLAMSDANWILLIGAVPRKAGMERSDLLSINGKIFSNQGKFINDYASSDVRVLVVGNPCNTNAMITMNNAPDIPNDRFYAMTMLDELRAKAQLAKKSNCNVGDVTNFAVWGNHSSTQYPDFYNAKIKNQTVVDVIKDENWLQTDFLEKVQNRGSEIIKARGASSAASAANAVIATIKCLANDTDQNDFFSVCKCSNGEYGIDEGLLFSFPCRTVAGKVNVVEGIQHNDFGNSKIQATLKELLHERDLVKKLGFIG